MSRYLLMILSLFFVSQGFAQNTANSYPQRCYFSGTYDEGIFTKTIWDFWVRDKFGDGDISGLVAYSFVRVSDIPRHLMNGGSDLDTLLKLKIIAVARFMPSTKGAPRSVMVLRKDSFLFVNEHSDLSSFIILMAPFGDQPILTELVKINPGNLLMSTIVGPVEESDAVCNW